MKIITARIATIGDEILIGQILDTNSQWLAQELKSIGMEVTEMLSLSDTQEAIEGMLDSTKQDVLILTGGLGPTKDDITKKTMTNYFDDELIEDRQILEKLKRVYASKGRELNSLNRTQALIPSKCDVLINNHGTASGMVFQNGGQIIISLPGVPREMKGIMNDFGFDYLKSRFNAEKTEYRTFHTVGIPESNLAIKLAEWEADLLNEGLGLAFLPNLGKVRLRISKISQSNQGYVERKVSELYDLIGDNIFGEGDTSLNQELSNMLKNKGKSVSTAESCTGGNIAKNLTSLPGSSSFFEGSIVSYSNRIKSEVLGVEPQTSEKFGAVSEETVLEMSLNVKNKLGTDASIAVSGIAGPDGGSAEKPVGTVWVAVRLDEYVETKKLTLTNNRSVNIELTTTYSLEMLRRILKDA